MWGMGGARRQNFAGGRLNFNALQLVVLAYVRSIFVNGRHNRPWREFFYAFITLICAVFLQLSATLMMAAVSAWHAARGLPPENIE